MRARLLTVFKEAFTLWKSIRLLQTFTRGDYERLVRKIPLEQFRDHLAHDDEFMVELIVRRRAAGIPTQIESAVLSGLMHALFLTNRYQGHLEMYPATGTIDLLRELIAAYCLGEIRIEQPTNLIKTLA